MFWNILNKRNIYTKSQNELLNTLLKQCFVLFSKKSKSPVPMRVLYMYIPFVVEEYPSHIINIAAKYVDEINSMSL